MMVVGILDRRAAQPRAGTPSASVASGSAPAIGNISQNTGRIKMPIQVFAKDNVEFSIKRLLIFYNMNKTKLLSGPFRS